VTGVKTGSWELLRRSFLPALAAGLLLVTQTAVGAAQSDAVYTRPGRLVAADDGAKLNLYCMGHGSPAVVFDSGWEDWAPAWAIVQPRVAKWTRACAYDRAGAGFSEAGPMPRTSVRISGELRSALHRAGIAGPYILVGHAFGSDNVRTFADLYMPEVAGVVLVEGDVMDLEPADLQDADHKGEVNIIARLRECRDQVASGKPLLPLPPRPGRPPRTCAQQFFRGIPEMSWSPQLNAKLLEIAQTKVAMYDAYISEMEQMPRDEAYLQQHQRSYGARPLRTVTTGRHGVGSLTNQPPPSAEQSRYEDEAGKAQSRWLALSSNGKQIFADNSSEYVVFDAPDAVVDAIRETYDVARKPGRRTAP
jgi:pimeloyl-ACP methyl ester carboxylesterase